MVVGVVVIVDSLIVDSFFCQRPDSRHYFLKSLKIHSHHLQVSSRVLYLVSGAHNGLLTVSYTPSLPVLSPAYSVCPLFHQRSPDSFPLNSTSNSRNTKQAAALFCPKKYIIESL